MNLRKEQNVLHGTVEQVVMVKHCMSCRMCSSICPQNAILMVYRQQSGLYVPELNEEKCVNCGKCLRYCPTMYQQEKNSLVGTYRALLLAHSTYKRIRHWSTSSGVINSLVRYLLDTGMVEKVLMVGYDSGSRIEASPMWITKSNEKELEINPRDFASRYVSVPLLSEMTEVNRKENIAVVGTLCQLQALSGLGGG